MVGRDPLQTHAISYDSQYNQINHRSRVLRHTDGPNLSNSCVSVAFLFSITRTSADQSIFVGYPSEDCRQYSVDSVIGVVRASPTITKNNLWSRLIKKMSTNNSNQCSQTICVAQNSDRLLRFSLRIGLPNYAFGATSTAKIAGCDIRVKYFASFKLCLRVTCN